MDFFFGELKEYPFDSIARFFDDQAVYQQFCLWEQECCLITLDNQNIFLSPIIPHSV